MTIFLWIFFLRNVLFVFYFFLKPYVYNPHYLGRTHSFLWLIRSTLRMQNVMGQTFCYFTQVPLMLRIFTSLIILIISSILPPPSPLSSSFILLSLFVVVSANLSFMLLSLRSALFILFCMPLFRIRSEK